MCMITLYITYLNYYKKEYYEDKYLVGDGS